MKDKKILVVEDNDLNRKLVRSLLSIRKYECLEACDAETGIQLAQEAEPDLVLMDIQLPGMDGFTATKLLKANDKLKSIPIIALTSYAMEEDREKAKNAGCEGYISKPIDTRTFLDEIAVFIQE